MPPSYSRTTETVGGATSSSWQQHRPVNITTTTSNATSVTPTATRTTASSASSRMVEKPRYARAMEYANHYQKTKKSSQTPNTNTTSSKVRSSSPGTTSMKPLKPPSPHGAASPSVMYRTPPLQSAPPAAAAVTPSPQRKMVVKSRDWNLQQQQQRDVDGLSGKSQYHTYQRQQAPPPPPPPPPRTDPTLVDWRNHGKELRAQWVLEDERAGGNAFALSKDCSIDRYYKVAERVWEQFLASSVRKTTSSNTAATSEELQETYLVGNRLVKFLSMVLPTHPEYFLAHPSHLPELRKTSQEQLVQLLERLEQLSLVIDELEYNKYILRDLTPMEADLVKGLTTMGSSGANTTTPASTPSRNPANPSHYKWKSSPADLAMAKENLDQRQAAALQQNQQQQQQQEGQDHNNNNNSYLHRSALDDSASTQSITQNSRTSDPEFEQRVAEVVRITESFSDAYEAANSTTNNNGSDVHSGSTKPMGGKGKNTNNALLHQTLLAASKTLRADQHRWQSSETNRAQLSSLLHPQQQQQQQPQQISPQEQQHHHFRPHMTPSPAPSDPSLQQITLPSIESSSDPQEEGEDTDSFARNQSALNTTWETDDFSDFDFGPAMADVNSEIGGGTTTAARIDLLEDHDSPSGTPQPKRISSTSSKSNAGSIPKLKKQPPTGPSRAARLRVAAAMQFDHVIPEDIEVKQQNQVKSDPIETSAYQQAPFSSGLPGMVTDPIETSSYQQAPFSSGLPGMAVTTKIEKRLERAKHVEATLDTLAETQVDEYFEEWRRQQALATKKPTALEDNPLNPFNDEVVEDSSNRRILRHFKGCVKCLID